MNKQYQIIILVVAVLISGLTYGLLRWKVSDKLDPQAPVILSKQIDFGNQNNAALSVEGFYTVLVLVKSQTDEQLAMLDVLMGGLVGFQDKVRAVVVVIDPTKEAQQANYGKAYPKILLMHPRQDQTVEILRQFRQCTRRADCAKIAEQQNLQPWLYVLDDQRRLLYIADQRWGVVRVVSDIRRYVSSWLGMS